MTSIGDTLRNARESQGRTLAGIAQELCITQSYVAAIEKGDGNNLPGLFFYKSFARQYAAVLGIEEALIRPQLEALSDTESPSPRPDIRVLDPLVESTNRRFIPDIPLGWSVAGLAAVLLLCSGFYSWWNRIPEQHIPEQTTAQPSTPPVASTRVAAPQVTTGAAVETIPVVNSAPEALNGIVLKLSATERTWLSISSGGKEIFSGFLQPSESKILSGLDIATMRVGNAAGIDVHWNGKPIGPLGTRGQVLTIRFTPQDFEIVPPKQQL
jgi:cytoskeleton protein RodZ